eukprot:Skav229947  [mRNA]  locus=scaffold2665:165693:168035:- [translate_table: standard]
MKATMPAPATRAPERVSGEVNGEEEDTLSKARKAAKVHLHALKEHVEQAGRVVFSAAESVKTERRALMEESIQAGTGRYQGFPTASRYPRYPLEPGRDGPMADPLEAQSERKKAEAERAELHAKQEQLQRDQEDSRIASPMKGVTLNSMVKCKGS